MSETRTVQTWLRRTVLPILVAVLLVVATVLLSSSALIRIEDVTTNRILAGAYGLPEGTPDWRVQEMNPLLAMPLTLLYRVLPSINWYGGMLLALLALAAATGISLGARKAGGFWPSVMVMGPIVVLMTHSMISTVVCALCAVTGALSLMDGLARRRGGQGGLGSLIWGAVLFTLGAMLSLPIALVIAVAAALCWAPGMVREGRTRGLLLGALVLAIILAALFGCSALMYSSPELSAYRADYASYESLQHSSLRDESSRLLSEYGLRTYTDGHDADDGHDHSEDEIEAAAAMPENVFSAAGWTLNDASLFFTRYSSDAKLVDPETVRALDAQASHWDFSPGRLFGVLWETVKKPQFLMLIALFILSAIAVAVTGRKVGVVALAAVVAFGGHVAMVAHYYDTFASIAPFYLFGIGMMLFAFDGEEARAWYKRVVTAGALRVAISAVVLAVFIAGMGGLVYYTRQTAHNPSEINNTAVAFLKEYIAVQDENLLIGENPNERYKPETLAAPVRGEDRLLLAGSYDLYSPRRAELMQAYGIENPLPDSIGREDIAYVLMGFSDPVAVRVAEAYELYLMAPETLAEYPEYSEAVVRLKAQTLEEAEAQIQEEARQVEELNQIIEEALGIVEQEDAQEHDYEDDEAHDHDHPEDTQGAGNG